MTTATKFETSSKNGVEVSAAGGESSTDHTGGNSMLGFFQRNEARSNPADPSGNTLNDGCMEDRYSEVSSANIVDRRMGTANMGLSNFNGPQNLDKPEDSNASNDL